MFNLSWATGGAALHNWLDGETPVTTSMNHFVARQCADVGHVPRMNRQ